MKEDMADDIILEMSWPEKSDKAKQQAGQKNQRETRDSNNSSKTRFLMPLRMNVCVCVCVHI